MAYAHTKERDIQKAILDYLKLRGYLVWKNNTAGIYKQKTGSYIPSPSVGAPDIFVIRSGTLWGIEVKTAKGKLSDYQKAFGDAMKLHGAEYVVARSLDDVTAVL